MAFHNTRLPADIEKGAFGGPRFATNVVVMSSGIEKRNQTWERVRGTWDVGYGVDSKSELEDVIAFFYARQGRLHAFRFKDWSDYQVGTDSTDTPQEIGVGDDSTTVFYAVRRYTSGSEYYDRILTRLVAGTVRVFLDSVEQTVTVDYTVDIETGAITFNSAPALDTSVGLICEFDVPVRFDIDNIDMRSLRDDVIEIPELKIIEIREQPSATVNTRTSTSTSTSYTLSRIATRVLDVSAQDSSPRDVYVNPTGTKFMVTGRNGITVEDYLVATQYDPEGASSLSSTDLSAQVSANMTGLEVGNSGAQMLIGDRLSAEVHEYSLSSTYDPSSKVFVQTHDFSSYTSDLKGIRYDRVDGTRFYILDATNKAIEQFSLTAYDLTTVSKVGELDVSAISSPESFDFNDDGTTLIVSDAGSNKIHEYTLSTAWLVSSGSKESYELPFPHDSSLSGIRFDPYGRYIYAAAASSADAIYRISI